MSQLEPVNSQTPGRSRTVSQVRDHLSPQFTQCDSTCAICLAKIDNLAKLPSCTHEFCLSCITSWSNINNTCPLCKRRFNSICPSNASVIAVADRSQESNDGADYSAAGCQICGSGHDEARLLICDGCEQCYHLYCLAPPLDRVPLEEWFCPECEFVALQAAESDVQSGPQGGVIRITVPRAPVLRAPFDHEDEELELTDIPVARPAQRSSSSDAFRRSFNPPRRIQQSSSSSSNAPRVQSNIERRILQATFDAINRVASRPSSSAHVKRRHQSSDSSSTSESESGSRFHSAPHRKSSKSSSKSVRSKQQYRSSHDVDDDEFESDFVVVDSDGDHDGDDAWTEDEELDRHMSSSKAKSSKSTHQDTHAYSKSESRSLDSKRTQSATTLSGSKRRRLKKIVDDDADEIATESVFVASSSPLVQPARVSSSANPTLAMSSLDSFKFPGRTHASVKPETSFASSRVGSMPQAGAPSSTNTVRGASAPAICVDLTESPFAPAMRPARSPTDRPRGTISLSKLLSTD